jgi:hypothetical protein
MTIAAAAPYSLANGAGDGVLEACSLDAGGFERMNFSTLANNQPPVDVNRTGADSLAGCLRFSRTEKDATSPSHDRVNMAGDRVAKWLASTISAATLGVDFVPRQLREPATWVDVP